MRWMWALGVLLLMCGAAWADAPPPDGSPYRFRPPPGQGPPPSFWAGLAASLGAFFAGLRRRLGQVVEVPVLAIGALVIAPFWLLRRGGRLAAVLVVLALALACACVRFALSH